jgi:hypothetical protein
MEIPSITAAVQTVAFMGVALPDWAFINSQLCDHQRPKNERDQDKSGGGLAFQVFLAEEFQNHQQCHENHQKPVNQSHHGLSPLLAGCLETSIMPSAKACGDLESAAHSSICEHLQKPHNEGSRP